MGCDADVVNQPALVAISAVVVWWWLSIRAGWGGPYVCHLRFLMAAYMSVWLVLSIVFTGK